MTGTLVSPPPSSHPPVVAVIDDDPTGSQMVRGIDVWFGVDADSAPELVAAGKGFVLTNSRSLAPAAAFDVNRQLASSLAAAAADRPIIVVSRSDSTLRGHIREEADGLVDGLREGGRRGAIRRIFCPAYISAGRITTGSVHYLVDDRRRTPVSDSEFAKDTTFAYRSSDLREFLVERGMADHTDEVMAVTLGDIRDGGSARVRAIITAAEDRWVVVDAEQEHDLDVVAAAVVSLSREGVIPLIRSGPSFVRAAFGQSLHPPLTDAELAATFPARPGNSLTVVGSHVPLTTAQLTQLLALAPVRHVEVAAPALLAEEGIDSAITLAVDALRAGDLVVSTSRSRIDGDLSTSRHVSQALAHLIRDIVAQTAPAWCVAKGGITSHDLASAALGIRRARVVGQLLPGQVSILTPVDAPAHLTGMPYVVFPGNVGGNDALLTVHTRLTSALRRDDDRRTDAGRRTAAAGSAAEEETTS